MNSLMEILNQPWTVSRFVVVTVGAVSGLMCAMMVMGRWSI